METINEQLGVEKVVLKLRANACGVEAWIECEDEHPESWMQLAAAQAVRHGGRATFIRQLSVAPFLFYRFSNGRRLWDVTRESFEMFARSGDIEVWQEESPYPRPGVVRKWLESLL